MLPSREQEGEKEGPAAAGQGAPAAPSPASSRGLGTLMAQTVSQPVSLAGSFLHVQPDVASAIAF